MKKIFFIITVFALLLSCNKDDKEDSIEVRLESIEATSDDTWHYYCATAKKVVGTGLESDNEIWASKTNWDIGFQKHRIKINGGTSGPQNKGGLAIYNGSMSFDKILELPSSVDFKLDSDFSDMINEVETTISRSEYQVVNFMDDSNEYTEAPIYILRGDAGDKFYKIDIINHMVGGEAGNIQFKIAQLAK